MILYFHGMGFTAENWAVGHEIVVILLLVLRKASSISIFYLTHWSNLFG